MELGSCLWKESIIKPYDTVYYYSPYGSGKACVEDSLIITDNTASGIYCYSAKLLDRVITLNEIQRGDVLIYQRKQLLKHYNPTKQSLKVNKSVSKKVLACRTSITKRLSLLNTKLSALNKRKPEKEILYIISSEDTLYCTESCWKIIDKPRKDNYEKPIFTKSGCLLEVESGPVELSYISVGHIIGNEYKITWQKEGIGVDGESSHYVFIKSFYIDDVHKKLLVVVGNVFYENTEYEVVEYDIKTNKAIVDNQFIDGDF